MYPLGEGLPMDKLQINLTWQEVIDSFLVELGRNYHQFEDRMIPLTIKTVNLAIILAEDLDYYNSPEPTDFFVDSYGSIVFEREVGNRKIIATILPTGGTEYLAYGLSGGTRRRMVPRYKTEPENFWLNWILEAESK